MKACRPRAFTFGGWLCLLKKTLNNAGHIDAKLIHFLKFAEKNPAKSAIFYWLFLGEVSPWSFPWKRPIFLRICPWKSFEIWLFSAKIPRNRTIFRRILTFLPRKSREIGRFFREFAPENPVKFCFFFREISEALNWKVDFQKQYSTARQ